MDPKVKNNAKKNRGPVLGIEGGGTKTTWILLGEKGEILAQGKLGPGNFFSVGANGLLLLFRKILRALPLPPATVGICLAGCTGETVRQEILSLARKVFPKAASISVGEDTESGLWAAHGSDDGVLIIAGTGSNVVGKKRGKILKAGGWGFLLGDPGSAYDIAILALRQIYVTFDQTGYESPLAKACRQHAGADSLEDLVNFIYRHHGKEYVASFAQVIFTEAEKGNLEAQKILRAASSSLALTTKAVLARLRLSRQAIALTGGLFEKSPRYVNLFKKELRLLGVSNPVFVSQIPGHFGAAAFALGRKKQSLSVLPGPKIASLALPLTISSLPTEQRNPRSRHLEKRSVAELVDVFLKEELHVRKALAKIRPELVQAASLISQKMKQGGRLLYLGAGTSGRLGVLDASEIPPTFGVSLDRVQGIIAGGYSALIKSEEGAEDDSEAGASAVIGRQITGKDVVLGIAASGRTPYVLGALKAAQKKGAATVLLTCNPQWRSDGFVPDVGLHLPTGPELISGSTRLKAGTATKIVLNLLSSIAMIRLGKVHDNLMIDLNVTNEKLAARAVHLLRQLKDCSPAEAEAALREVNWNIRKAATNLKKPR